MKFCYTCNQEKDLSEFAKDRSKKDGLRTQCKSCRAFYQKQHNSKLDIKEKNINYRKNVARFRQYDLTKTDYEQILEKQNGVCAICSGELKNSRIDHCHDTGKVRGVLCQKCNHGLGMFSDNPELMLKAVNYLHNKP